MILIFIKKKNYWLHSSS